MSDGDYVYVIDNSFIKKGKIEALLIHSVRVAGRFIYWKDSEHLIRSSAGENINWFRNYRDAVNALEAKRARNLAALEKQMEEIQSLVFF